MREAYKRCTHCQDIYICLLSGHQSNAHTDSKYCPVCHETITKALSTVPRKYKRVWAKTDVVNLEMLLKWEEQDKNYIKRVSFPLFNLETGQANNHGIVKGQGYLQGRLFKYAYWPGKEQEVEIEEEMEQNLLTGELLPWKNYD